MGKADELNRDRSAFEVKKDFDKALFAVGPYERVDLIGETERRARVRFSPTEPPLFVDEQVRRLEGCGLRVARAPDGRVLLAEGEVDKTDLFGEHVRWEDRSGTLFRVVLELDGARLLFTTDASLARRHGFFARRDGRYVRWFDGQAVLPPVTAVLTDGEYARVMRREKGALVVGRVQESARPDDEAARLEKAGFKVTVEVMRGPDRVRRLLVASKRVPTP
jgi:hypothetical protein